MGPTVLGEVMAAGNLIWASPPYLFEQRSSRFECVNDRRSHIPLPVPLIGPNRYLKKALVAHCETSRSQAELEEARISAVAQACSSCKAINKSHQK